MKKNTSQSKKTKQQENVSKDGEVGSSSTWPDSLVFRLTFINCVSERLKPIADGFSPVLMVKW